MAETIPQIHLRPPRLLQPIHNLTAMSPTTRKTPTGVGGFSYNGRHCPFGGGMDDGFEGDDAQQGLPAVLRGEEGNGLPGGGPHRRKGAPGNVPPGAPAEGDAPALPDEIHRALHGPARPGLVAVFLGQIARLVPVPWRKAVKHGPEEGAPGGLPGLVGGLDDIQTLL